MSCVRVGAIGSWRQPCVVVKELREVCLGAETGFCRDLRDGNVRACQQMHGAADAKGDLVFEQSKAVVLLEAAAEHCVAHSKSVRQLLEVDDFAEVVGNVQVRPAALAADEIRVQKKRIVFDAPRAWILRCCFMDLSFVCYRGRCLY